MTDADGGHDLRCFPDHRFRGAEKQNAVEKRVADFLLNRFGRTGCILQKMNAASGIDQRVSRFGKHPPCCADIIEIVSAGNLDPCKRCGFAVLQNEAFAWIGERADTGFPDQKTLCGHLFQRELHRAPRDPEPGCQSARGRDHHRFSAVAVDDVHDEVPDFQYFGDFGSG